MRTCTRFIPAVRWPVQAAAALLDTFRTGLATRWRRAASRTGNSARTCTDVENVEQDEMGEKMCGCVGACMCVCLVLLLLTSLLLPTPSNLRPTFLLTSPLNLLLVNLLLTLLLLALFFRLSRLVVLPLLLLFFFPLLFFFFLESGEPPGAGVVG